MAKETVLVGVANIGERQIELDIVKSWTPQDVTYVSDNVYFKQEETYYLMKKVTYDKIFKKA